MRIRLPYLGREPGRGFWSLRPHALSTENIEEFHTRWQYWARQRRSYPSWMAWWLSYAKPKIKSFFRWKSKIAHDHFHREHQRLYAQLRQAYDSYFTDATVLPTINHLKGKMLALQREFTQAFLRINETYVAGEEISIFQLGERRRKRTTITHLRGEGNEDYNTSEAIERHMLDYFQQLYSENEQRYDAGDLFDCDRIVPENDESNLACTSEITTAEISHAIRSAARRKSPGSDGIPNEFYLRVFDTIHRELNLVLNDAISGQFPPDFVDGIIVLVKKRGGDDTARAYRPISLLNCDYKIFSRILKNRLEKVTQTHRILTDSQKCANFPRNIFQATLSLKDRLAQHIQRKQNGKLVSFDLDHAFDRVRHSFLYRTMCSLGINRDLVSLLARISSRSSSRLLVNGHLSAPFPIERSVRQGDPMSSLLFVIYLHPLVSRLERVHGNNLIVAYADDISVISSDAQSINEMREIFSSFEAVSGAMLNVNKTQSIDIGDIGGQNTLRIPWLQTTNTLKILGVVFANSIRQMVKLNWDKMVTSFAQLVWMHTARSLSLHQKISLLNIFVSSRMWYLSSTLPPSPIHVGKITATMGSFLWSRIPARIPMVQLARHREKGGLKLQLPGFKCKALLINRHIQEIDSMPYYQSLLTPITPSPATPSQTSPIPADLPDAKLLRQQLTSISPQILQNSSANLIHRTFIEQTDEPKVVRNHPNQHWSKIWRNIASPHFTAAQKSTLYMLVNEKIPHRKLYHIIGRANGENCVYCNTAVETIQHKFSECPRVAHAWAFLQRKVSSFRPGRRQITFEDLLRPSLTDIPAASRTNILKLFACYINYVNDVNVRIDVRALEFHLASEV